MDSVTTNLRPYALIFFRVATLLLDKCIKIIGSSEEDEVSGFFVLSHLWMRGYFRLG